MKRLLWIIVIALWIALLASALFTRVEADDYCYAATVQDQGLLGSVPYWYNAWSGSYSEHFTSSLFALVEPYGARIGIPLMLAGFVLTWWYAFTHWYRKWDALLLALAFGAALALSRPNDEPIYWISGLVNYWVPLAGVGLLIGLLARQKMVLASLIAFFVVAFSEVTAALILAGLGLAFLFWKGERRRLLLVGLIAALGLLITYIAPGTDVRKSALDLPQFDLSLAVEPFLRAFATGIFFPLVWTIGPGLFLSGVGAVLPPPFSVRRLPLFFLLLALGSSVLLSVLGVIMLGGGVEPRAVFPLNVFWLAQFFFLGAVIGPRIRQWRWLVVAGAVLLIPAMQHVIARAGYARQWDARHAQILAGEVVTVQVEKWDTLYMEGSWIEGCAETWYGHEIRFADVPPS